KREGCVPHRRRRRTGDIDRPADRARPATGRRALRRERLSARVASAWRPAYHSTMPGSGAPARSPRAWRGALGAALTGAVLTVALTYPTARYFGSVGRFDSGDGRL